MASVKEGIELVLGLGLLIVMLLGGSAIVLAAILVFTGIVSLLVALMIDVVLIPFVDPNFQWVRNMLDQL